MAGNKRCVVCRLVAVLVMIGALNWGLVGILQVDLVAPAFGELSGVTRAIYTLIGVAGVIALLSAVRPCSACEAKKPS